MGAKTWLHIQDFELDAAFQLRMLSENRLLRRLAVRVEKRILMKFDRVSTISEMMLSRLLQKDVSPSNTFLFPNWVDLDEIYPLNPPDDYFRQLLGIHTEDVVVLYSGNMGEKQGLEFLISAASRLKERQDIRFVFCGEGAVRRALEDAAKDLPNVYFLPLQPPEKMNVLLNTADIHILSQRSDLGDAVMPSKLLPILASGKPVIAAVNPESELGKIVSGVGLVVPYLEEEALCQAILNLVLSPVQRSQLGTKGRAYVQRYWRKDLVFEKFGVELEKIISA